MKTAHLCVAIQTRGPDAMKVVGAAVFSEGPSDVTRLGSDIDWAELIRIQAPTYAEARQDALHWAKEFFPWAAEMLGRPV